MRTALLVVLSLCLTGCWKEIHEAAAPVRPPLGQATVASTSENERADPAKGRPVDSVRLDRG